VFFFFFQVELDLSYKERFYTGAGSVYSPDAYTRLMLDTLMGKQSAFVRGDELIESWKVTSMNVMVYNIYNLIF
jgi:glucose-6-phosphate 1-dehydrogenase